MSYSTFRNRMNSKGGTRYERNFNKMSRSFELWFENTLAKEEVEIDGVKQYAVINDQNQNNNKDLSDDKYMVVKNESNLKVGSIMKWRDREWLIFSDEEKSVPTHKQTKIRPSNGRIKWMINGKVSGVEGNGHPAVIKNNTLYTLGLSTSGHHSWIVNAKMLMYMQDNSETRNIALGQRVFISGAVYQVMFKEWMSRNGMIQFLLEEDFVDPSRDNVELGIADYYIDGKEQGGGEEEKPKPVEKTVVITGSEKARIGATVKYEANVYEDGNVNPEEGIVEWTVMDDSAVATIVEQSTKGISIRIVSNFQKVGSQITIVGKTADGVLGSKTVKIISPY
ncbi:hypothetical protein CON39_11465 [Bacillus thuringiensis]|uniref:hypothetical protein n=1 Tax=Bacillus thuringiensis TaxID=1428 RepID=UPI000BEE6CDF|nr:hypothetical protein [Bacillus thuringiensis]PEF30287.1 hypothetical protein CON39_11465 [Bacillus thuringiensis]